MAVATDFHRNFLITAHYRLAASAVAAYLPPVRVILLYFKFSINRTDCQEIKNAMKKTNLQFSKNTYKRYAKRACFVRLAYNAIVRLAYDTVVKKISI
jgi:hypothetical protein